MEEHLKRVWQCLMGVIALATVIPWIADFKWLPVQLGLMCVTLGALAATHYLADSILRNKPWRGDEAFGRFVLLPGGIAILMFVYGRSAIPYALTALGLGAGGLMVCIYLSYHHNQIEYQRMCDEQDARIRKHTGNVVEFRRRRYKPAK